MVSKMGLFDFLKKAEKQNETVPTVFRTSTDVRTDPSVMNLLSFFKNWSGVCINKRADSLMNISNYAVKFLADGTTENLDSNHWLSQLLVNPNKPSKLTWNNIKDLTSKWLDVSGNAYIWTPLNGYKYPTQLWVLPSNNVIVKGDNTNMVGYFQVQTSKGVFDVPVNEMCHIKTIMPHTIWERNYVIGSPLRLYNAIDSISADYEIKDFLKNHFKQEAMNPIILKGDSQQEIDLLKENLSRRMKATVIGAMNKNTEIFNVPQSSLVNSIAGSNFSSNQNAVLIASAFGIPYGMLDTTSQQNRATAETNYSQFRTETIEPLMLLIESALNNHFNQFEQGIGIIHDSYEYVDQQNELEKLKLVVSANALTINELRSAYNLEPISDGDVLINNLVNALPIEQTIKTVKKKV